MPTRPSHPRLTLLATILASTLAFIDGSVVNVALPAIGRDLHASAADLQWTINAYLLPLSALLLLGGAAGDHFGRRRMLIGGIALFAAASFACALAPGLGVLLAARVVQGVGAAMLMPNSLSILSHAFSGEEKGRAVGTWAAVGAIASAFGPPLGGWLVDSVGWRAIFFISLPVAAAAIGLALTGVAESGEGQQPLDWPGAALATVALGALTWALTLWSSQRVMTEAAWIALGVGLATLALFVIVEHRRCDRAMMPLALFGTKAFVGLTSYTFLLYGALGGLIVLLPFVLITGGGYSPVQAGLALLPFSIGIGLGSRAMGILTERIGPRWPLTIGPLVVAAGFALMLRVEPQASYWTSVLPGIAAIALGMAMAVAPLTTAVLSSVDDEHTGTASGFNSAIARTGGLIATASCGAVIAASGAALLGAFHMAAVVGAGLAIGAGASAFASFDAKPG
ncbi:MFS transporter [Sphingomonas sp.]|uniref:MFS transporter n=1 Tax=Sphingomonas sp. TaxID=28214 RepID=UPI0025F7E112|nr:MFS transporter [Sphingomonas sp.]